MPGALTNSGAAVALDAATGRAAVAARTYYLALWTADPTAAGTPATAGEYAAGGYARVTYTPVAPAAVGTGATAAQQTSNNASITFGPLTGANGTTVITHCALVSTASGTTGDMAYRWALDASRTPAAGDSITVAVNAVAARIIVAAA